MHVNAGLAHLSDTLLFVAVVGYALAMLAFAVELAFGRVAAEPVPAGGPAARRGGRMRWAASAAVALTGLGWLAHVGSVSTRGLSESRVPWGNMYEFSSMVALIAVSVFLVVVLAPAPLRRLLAGARERVRRVGLFVMLSVVVYLGIAGTLLYAPPGPLVPALHSYWIKIHVVAAITASGAFMISGILTILYLVRSYAERRGSATSLGPGAASTYELSAASRAGSRGILGRLPSSATLDRLAFRVVAFAFPIWTFAIMAGAIWARAAWGRYWGWDPKETWSFITWVAYAAYLHARATGGWKGRKAAVLCLAGFGCLLVDYYVVNTVVVGLHSYAGTG